MLTFYPAIYSGRGPAYTAIKLAEAMGQLGTHPHFLTSWALRSPPVGVDFETVAHLRLPYRLLSRLPLLRMVHKRAERRALEHIERSVEPVALHLWFGASVGFIRKAQAKGAVIFREMINTHQGTAKRILDVESARCGLPQQHSITDRAIAAEREELHLCDFVISPSAGVDESLDEIGIPAQRIIRSSFGWDPVRFEVAATQAETKRSHAADGLTAVFVGQLSIRKGMHLALNAWEKAGVPGKFVLVGQVDRDCVPILERYLTTGRVEHYSYTPDISRFYRDADFLLFPTLEEGAPLVCYEAAGNGLPVVTSRMGAARLVEHDVNGMLIDPHDAHALVEAIRAMQDDSLRGRLASAAREAASRRSWTAVAQERLDAIAARMS